MALAGDIASPCGGKYVRLANGFTKAAKINVWVQQPNLQIFAYFVILRCLGFVKRGRRPLLFLRACSLNSLYFTNTCTVY